MPDIPRKPATFWQRIVGIFVAWQLLFLLSSNALAFLPFAEVEEGELSDSRGAIPGERSFEGIEPLRLYRETLKTWAQATGQTQAWWLFAPSFPADATFPLVTLHWSHGESADVSIPSHQVPKDPTFYIRFPGSSDRLFHYEMRLGLIAAFISEELLRDHAPEWTDLFKVRARRQWMSMRAYMNWQAETYRKEHPELPAPDQVTLSILAFRTPDPGHMPPHWEPPLQQPLARWIPAWDGRTDLLSVEYFDQVQKQFLPLAAKE